MTTFYVSPSSLSYKQYSTIVSAASGFGWKPRWVWTREIFRPDALVKPEVLAKVLKSFVHTDIFIATMPCTCSTCVEIGIAYTLCEDVLLVARDPVHFTQTGLSDAYLAAMPGIKRACCTIEEIPAMLSKEYLNLIDPV